VIYTNPGTDPYSNDTGPLLDENGPNLNSVIGNANFDVGHVLGYDANFGSGGGLAGLGVICTDFNPAFPFDGSKANGASVIGSGYGQVFYDQLLQHEMGHQFGMTHSYNSIISVCTSREASTSVEPGAGATIMSYGFTCTNTDAGFGPIGDNDYFQSQQIGPILRFHTVNYEQAYTTIINNSCYTAPTTGNASPVVTMPPAYTITKSTPFALTGSATDANSEPLTYSWEGTNIGTSEPNAATLENAAEPPFFRTYEPVTLPTRTFPSLSAILAGTNQARGDKLPSVGIVTTHRLTVRDNVATGGGLTYGNVSVTVDGNIGPFLETTNLFSSYPGNSQQTITWSVNGTDAATPNVNILLSTDGGQTFPTVLAAGTGNDGSEVITLPNINTTMARIKVEAVGNIFFDISNTDFSISPSACTPPPLVFAPTVTQPTCATPTGAIYVNASGVGSFEYSVDNGASFQTNPSFSGLAGGSYNIIVQVQGMPGCLTPYAQNPVVVTAITVSDPITFPTPDPICENAGLVTVPHPHFPVQRRCRYGRSVRRYRRH
jgi:hypothetical protein